MNARDADAFLFEQDMREAGLRAAQQERELTRLAQEYARLTGASATGTHDERKRPRTVGDMYAEMSNAEALDLAGSFRIADSPVGDLCAAIAYGLLAAGLSHSADQWLSHFSPADRRRGLLLLCPLN